jgi:CRP-like cAMP-binding protein
MTASSYKDLSKYCYFSCLSDGALEALSKKLHLVELPAGTQIIRENTPADAFYLVSKGEVDVFKKTNWGQKATISVVGHGGGFGEMALLTCSPRCCSVIAKTDTTLLKLSKNGFEEIVQMDFAFSEMLEHRLQNYSQFNQIKTLQPFALLQPERIGSLTDKLSFVISKVTILYPHFVFN